MKTRLMALTLGLATIAPSATAQDVLRKPVAGSMVKQRTARVLQAIRWEKSFASLAKRARESRRPIFWMQIVGELGGGL